MRDEESEFFLHLPSNVAGNKNVGTGSLNKYRTQFSEPILLDPEYEVGITNISFTKTWYNVPQSMVSQSKLVISWEPNAKGVAIDEFKPDEWKHERTELLDFLNWKNILTPENYESLPIHSNSYIDILTDWPRQEKLLPLRAGHYASIGDIVTALNNSIHTWYCGISQYKDYANVLMPRFDYDGNANQIILISGFLILRDQKVRLCTAHVDGPLGDMLGFGPIRWADPIFSEYRNKASNSRYITQLNDCYDLSGGIRFLLVYSDLASNVRVGDSYSRLLRVVEVPTEAKYGDQVNITYSQVQYVPVARRCIKNTEIHIKDDCGVPIPFRFGRVMITLHFRKRQM